MQDIRASCIAHAHCPAIVTVHAYLQLKPYAYASVPPVHALGSETTTFKVYRPKTFA